MAPNHHKKTKALPANAEHNGALVVEAQLQRKGRPAAAGRELMRLVRCRLPRQVTTAPNDECPLPVLCTG